MSTLSSVNFALRHSPVSIMETDDEDLFDVLYNDDATPLTVSENPSDLEIHISREPRRYQTMGFSRTYDGLAAKLLLVVGELLADGTLKKDDDVAPD